MLHLVSESRSTLQAAGMKLSSTLIQTRSTRSEKPGNACSISLPGSSSHSKEVTEIKYPTTGKPLKTLEKLPLFTEAEMKKHIENSGKRMGSVDNHSVPTSLKRAKTFLQDEYLKDIEANDDENYFY